MDRLQERQNKCRIHQLAPTAFCLFYDLILKLETKVCEQTLKLACESLTFYLVLKASSLKYEAYIKKIDR